MVEARNKYRGNTYRQGMSDRQVSTYSWAEKICSGIEFRANKRGLNHPKE
jgi:hypothetical protein